MAFERDVVPFCEMEYACLSGVEGTPMIKVDHALITATSCQYHLL